MKSKVVLDAMGGDYGVIETVSGAVDAVNINENISIVLVGKEEEIKSVLYGKTYDKKRISIQNATEVIENDDAPTIALKEKKDSSLVVGLNLLKEGRGDCFISCGNTGALIAGSTLIVGRIKGIKRPGLGALVPNKKGYHLLLDCGANLEPKPMYLYQYGILGSIYMEEMLNIENPIVKIVNIGSEKGKGTETISKATDMLENSKINFKGNIEAREIPYGEADVVVTDAFTGNVILKLTEGMAKSVFEILKDEITKKNLYKLGALLSKPAFNNLKKKFDYKDLGGAPFLGLNSLVVKSHGNSDAKVIKSAILQCHKFIEKDITGKIKAKLGVENNDRK